MPLARARCPACTLPLGDPPHTKLSARCMRCGEDHEVSVAADGQPADFDAAFPPQRLLLWFASARIAMSNGTPGVALGACAKCSVPLVIPSRDPVSLPCPHCQEPIAGTAADVVMDLWPEPWAKVAGAGIDLEYRLEMVDDSTGMSAGCAVCAMPTPPGDEAMRCRRCSAITWVLREQADAPGGERRARRIQLGVRVNGTRGGLPFKAVVPVVQGEAMLRADAAIGAQDSGKLFLNIGGIGCAVLAGLAMILALVVGFCSSR